MTIQGWEAASHPLTTLLSLGLTLTRSVPINSRAGTSGCSSIKPRTSGRTGSFVSDPQRAADQTLSHRTAGTAQCVLRLVGRHAHLCDHAEGAVRFLHP